MLNSANIQILQIESQFLVDINNSRHLKQKIALPVPVSNERKIRMDNTAEQGFKSNINTIPID